MQCINKIYLIGNFFNGHRLYNSIRDLKLHFKDIDIQVCNGVNKGTIKIQKNIAYTDGNHFGEITETKILLEEGINIGHLACNISHMNIIKDAYDKEYNCILVAEDDLLLGRKADRVFNEAINFVPEDWELLRLSWFPSPGINVKDVNKYRYKGDGVWGTELYMINRNGIIKLHNHLKKGSRAGFDAQLHRYKDINQYIIKYSLGIQRNNYELDLNAARDNPNYKIKNNSNKDGYLIPTNKQSTLKFKII